MLRRFKNCLKMFGKVKHASNRITKICFLLNSRKRTQEDPTHSSNQQTKSPYQQPFLLFLCHSQFHSAYLEYVMNILDFTRKSK